MPATMSPRQCLQPYAIATDWPQADGRDNHQDELGSASLLSDVHGTLPPHFIDTMSEQGSMLYGFNSLHPCIASAAAVHPQLQPQHQHANFNYPYLVLALSTALPPVSDTSNVRVNHSSSPSLSSSSSSSSSYSTSWGFLADSEQQSPLSVFVPPYNQHLMDGSPTSVTSDGRDSGIDLNIATNTSPASSASPFQCIGATSTANSTIGSDDIVSHIINTSDDNKKDYANVSIADSSDAVEPQASDKPKPAWSELKTKAGKDRRRLPLACSACRFKKVRCSGDEPACKLCSRLKVDCIYACVDRRKSKKRGGRNSSKQVKKSKPAKRLQAKIVMPPLENTLVSPTQPLLNQMKVASPPSNHPSEWSELSTLSQENLPSKEIQQHLSEIFFDCVYGQPYHILHKPTYMKKLQNDTLPPVLVLAVCAVAARFSTHTSVANSSQPLHAAGQQWAYHARSVCMQQCEQPKLTIVICLILLAEDDFGACQMERGWVLGGLAIRMAYALQLHKDLDFDPQSQYATGQPRRFTSLEKEIRRRVMWACFLMDRFTAGDVDRPMFVSEESVAGLPLPFAERLFTLEEPTQCSSAAKPTLAQAERQSYDYLNHGDKTANIGSAEYDDSDLAAFIIRSVAIWGRTLAYANYGCKERDAYPAHSPNSQLSVLAFQNEHLFKTLPGHLQWSRSNVRRHASNGTISQYLLLHVSIPATAILIYQSSITRIHNPANPAYCAPEGFVDTVESHKLVAACQISHVLHIGESIQSFMCAPFAGYCAITSTSVQIPYLASENQDVARVVKANCHINMMYLYRLRQYWGGFEQIVSKIDQARNNKYHGSNIDERNTSPPVVQEPIHWFNQYPYTIDQLDPSLDSIL